jgi:carbonic anhydrase/acetyltransferase-like protein (isoleucine patch superfamily)
MKMITNYLDKVPEIDKKSYIFKTAVIIGDVKLKKESNIWFGAVVRGDVNSITIGERTNIQDNATVHVTSDTFPTVIGNEVTIGHNAVIHGSEIGDRVLVGMGAVLLDGCKIGRNCIIAANSILRNGTEVPQGVLVAGNPAKIKRELTQEEMDSLKTSSDNYVKYSVNYLTYSKDSIYSLEEMKKVLDNLNLK